MSKIELKTIIINPNQAKEYMYTDSALEEFGYEGTEAKKQYYYNWERFYTKDSKVYAFENCNHFNTQIYDITLIEFEDFDEVEETDIDLIMEKFLDECKGIEMTLENLQDIGIKYFGGETMDTYEDSVYYSKDEDNCSFGFNEFVVEYDFVKKDEDNILETTIKVTNIWLN